jgi:hypothetical protein
MLSSSGYSPAMPASLSVTYSPLGSRDAQIQRDAAFAFGERDNRTASPSVLPAPASSHSYGHSGMLRASTAGDDSLLQLQDEALPAPPLNSATATTTTLYVKNLDYSVTSSELLIWFTQQTGLLASDGYVCTYQVGIRALRASAAARFPPSMICPLTDARVCTC